MSSIVLVGPLPAPFNGQSIAFQMVADGLKERKISHDIVNLSRKERGRGGAASWGRALEYLGILMDFFSKTLFGRKTVYITIAQSCHGFFRDFIMIWFSWLKRHHIVCHLHGGNYDNFYYAQPWWLRWLIRTTLIRISIILVLGENLRDMYRFEPRLKEKIHVVLNGLSITLDKPQKVKFLPHNSIDPAPVRILYLSNLIESKGYLDLLEAVRILVKERGKHIESHFCGLFLANSLDDSRVRSAAHGRELFEGFVSEHALQKNVIYHGSVSGEDKITILRESHFFVLPTQYNNEGQPLSIIEAMALGNVVISTPYRAIPDMVVDGETGCLVPHHNPMAIVKTIEELMQCPQQFSQMSKAAINLFNKKFTREAHLNRIIPFLTFQRS